MSTRRVRAYERTSLDAADCAQASGAMPAKSEQEPRNARRFMQPMQSGGRELAQVGDDAAPERGQRIAAFERRHDPSLRVLLRDRRELARHPRVVLLDEREAGERIFTVGVESGGNEDQ